MSFTRRCLLRTVVLGNSLLSLIYVCVLDCCICKQCVSCLCLSTLSEYIVTISVCTYWDEENLIWNQTLEEMIQSGGCSTSHTGGIILTSFVPGSFISHSVFNDHLCHGMWLNCLPSRDSVNTHHTTSYTITHGENQLFFTLHDLAFWDQLENILGKDNVKMRKNKNKNYTNCHDPLKVNRPKRCYMAYVNEHLYFKSFNKISKLIYCEKRRFELLEILFYFFYCFSFSKED